MENWVICIAIPVVAIFIIVLLSWLSKEEIAQDSEAIAPKTDSEVEGTKHVHQTGIDPDRRDIPADLPPPSWMFPAGVISVIVGLLALVAGAAMGASHATLGGAKEFTFAAALINGFTNPLFFIGFPLGLYWCFRGKGRSGGDAALPQPKDPSLPKGENNPRLTHCPDCGGHVSRLAPMCPHCGRPLA